ncbi:MAG: hypothetical protein EAZ57_02175 [Cytophagales bacterium]|nr:MAG: hypothetical protein EAZ67_02410 [Cytophagales bacterium]TAF61928.1 MAG: hypothetical protein EAZ57_02175 [Cytophagales bacterium]
MTNKLKYLSLVVVLLFFCIFWAIQSQNSRATNNETQANFALEDTLGVDKFSFGAAVISKKSGTVWSINDKYEVDDDMLFSLFSVMKSLEVKRPVPAGQRNQIIDLFFRSGLEVKIWKGKEVYKKFFVAGDSAESYAMLDKGEPYEVYIPGGFYMPIRQLFEINEEEWRNRTILKTSSATLKTLSVEYTSKPEDNLYVEFKSSKSVSGLDSGYYTLRGEQAVNMPRLYQYLTQFTGVKCDAYVNDPAVRDSIQKLEPFSKISLVDLAPEQSDVLRVYPSRSNVLGLLEKSGQVVLLDPKYMSKLLGVKKAFLPTKK